MTAPLIAPMALAENTAGKVGIEERLGDVLPLDTFHYIDEDNSPIVLADLFDGETPVVLTLVYYSCPGICTPLLNELAYNIERCDLTPGDDFQLVTISFNPADTAELARLKRINILDTIETNKPDPEDWRFLVGDQENIDKITEAVGFNYVPDENGVDWVHAASVIFISPEGKISRYLNTLQFNPADLELAVVDASQGHARSFMQKIERLCYSFDPEGRAYVLKVNRIILGITLVFVLLFVFFLILKKPARKPDAPQTEGDAS
jgi:protein SCO1/2